MTQPGESCLCLPGCLWSWSLSQYMRWVCALNKITLCGLMAVMNLIFSNAPGSLRKHLCNHFILTLMAPTAKVHKINMIYHAFPCCLSKQNIVVSPDFPSLSPNCCSCSQCIWFNLLLLILHSFIQAPFIKFKLMLPLISSSHKPFEHYVS